MRLYVAYGTKSKKIFAEGTEAEVHRELNNKYPSFKVVEKRNDGRTDKERLMDPIYPEVICIKKADD